MLSRRQLLAASPTTLPLFLALSGCKGPAVLSAPPVVSQQTQVLLGAVTAEQHLIWIYGQVMSAYPGLAAGLRPLYAEHQAHLGQLRARVIEPPGSPPPGSQASGSQASGSQSPGTGTGGPHVAGTEAGALAQLRAVEQAAVSAQMSRLAAAPASLAQLYASIAACESTHVSVLSARIKAR